MPMPICRTRFSRPGRNLKRFSATPDIEDTVVDDACATAQAGNAPRRRRAAMAQLVRPPQPALVAVQRNSKHLKLLHALNKRCVCQSSLAHIDA